jgi:hypothetical protein
MYRVLETPYLSEEGKIVALRNPGQEQGQHTDEEYKNLCIGFKAFSDVARKYAKTLSGIDLHLDFLKSVVTNVTPINSSKYAIHDHNGASLPNGGETQADLFGMKQEIQVMAILTQRHNEKTGKQEWALVSKKKHDGKHRVLRWFGGQKPSEETVKKAERSIQYWKSQGALSGEASKVVNESLVEALEAVKVATMALNDALVHAEDMTSPQEQDLYSVRRLLSDGQKRMEKVKDSLTESKYQDYDAAALFAEAVVFPVVHTGGTSKQTLMDDLIKVKDALGVALSDLKAAHPNGRDYPKNLSAAEAQYHTRYNSIQSLITEIEDELMAISDQDDPRSR